MSAIPPFRYRFMAPYKSVMCVYKLWFGTKYIIWKAKALHQSVTMAATEIARRYALGVKEDDIWEKAIKHIGHRGVTEMKIEMVHEATDPTDMLITEFKLLREAKKDPDCLNKYFEPMVPKWIPLENIQQYDKAVIELNKPVVKKVKKNAKPKNVKVRAARRGSGK